MLMLMSADPEPWGPELQGGQRHRGLRRALSAIGLLTLVGVVALASTGFLLYRQAEGNLTRVALEELDNAQATDARHFLVVGSDARNELDDEQRGTLSLGDFEGQRSDTIIYVAISEDRSTVSLVSLPRDLLVLDEGRRRKLTDVFAGGADDLIRVVQDNFGLPVNHYAAVSLGGFIDVVRTLGGVDLCLDEPLEDWRAGADFDAGCYRMSAEQALAYVRSRQGRRADFQRIDRQQQFLRATLDELADSRVLVNVPQLFQLVENVASNVTTDAGLGVAQMRGLADEMRQVIREGVPMTTVPGYTRRIDGISYVVAYGPGTRAMFDEVREGRPVPDHGTQEEREATSVAIWSGGRTTETEIVTATLSYGAFATVGAGSGPTSLGDRETTTVYRLPGETAGAEWVAATLGAPVRPLPDTATVPAGADVVVAVGSDASS